MEVHDALRAIRRSSADGSLAELCRDHAIELVVLFGSATGTCSPRDIDLALGFVPGAMGTCWMPSTPSVRRSARTTWT
ncbi:MAG: hypothetical protein Q4D89_14465 [Arachnia propionica]|uniref:hypothetical protein n=1 Tax=Arachnia propionica TaxID=1750 RepID=UPI002710999B|nr:hypothetical protein [Arachnia propionica]